MAAAQLESWHQAKDSAAIVISTHGIWRNIIGAMVMRRGSWRRSTAASAGSNRRNGGENSRQPMAWLSAWRNQKYPESSGVSRRLLSASAKNGGAAIRRRKKKSAEAWHENKALSSSA